MKNSKEFPFEKARRITRSELATARKAIELKTGLATSSPWPTGKIRGR